MKIGVQFQTHGVDPRAFVRQVELALDLGVDAVYLWDHLVPFTGARGDSAWDSWSLLGSMVGAFEGRSAVAGVLVAPLSYREPAVIARAATTLAKLGNGSFILGVGAGGYEFDDELVTAPDTISQRMQNFSARLEKTRIEVDRQNGIFGTTVSLWVGGMGDRVTIPLARRYGDGWSGFGPPEVFAIKLKNLHRPDLYSSVLLTSQDGVNSVPAYMDLGVSEIIRSLGPTPEGTFNLIPLRELLAERDNCR